MSKTQFSRLSFQPQSPFYPPLVDLCLIPCIIVFFIGEYCFRDAATLSPSWSCTYPFYIVSINVAWSKMQYIDRG